MDNTKTIGGVDSQGFAINVPYTPISSASLAPTTPVPVATPQYKDFSSGIANNLSYTKSVYDNQVANVDALNKQAQTENSDYAKLVAQTGQKGFDTSLAMRQTGATDLAGQINKLHAQSNALALDTQAKTLAEQNKATGQNITSQAVQRNTADATRENFINQANIAMQVAIKTADYTTAKDLADQIVNAKYDQLEADIKAKMINIDGIYKQLTPAEKKVADMQKVLLERQDQEVADKKAQELAVSKLIIDASPVAPADVLQRAKDIQTKGGSATDVALALGQYGGDYLKNEYLREQIKTERSKRLQIDTKTSNLTPTISGAVTTPNGDSVIGLPTSTLEAIGKLKLGEGQANAVSFVARMIQSNKAIDAQIGKTKDNVLGGTTGYNPTTIVSGLGRFVSSDQSREYDRNAEDFIRAQLRKESGAMISDEEIAGGKRLYMASGFGQDEKDIIETQKKRDGAIKSMIAQAGPAAPYLQQYYEQSKTQADDFISANPELNNWYQNTVNAVQTSTVKATTGAGAYGFTDNQK